MTDPAFGRGAIALNSVAAKRMMRLARRPQ
jgi:hypothetical protein